MRNAARPSARAFRKPMVIEVLAEDPARVSRHRTVKKDRNVRQPSLRFYPLQMKQQALGAPDRKGGNNHRAPTPNRPLDRFRERFIRIARVMATIAVRRLDHK